MYKIIFIDEEKSQHDAFADYMDKYEDKAELICLFPLQNIEKTIHSINELHPDAIISDFLLNEYKVDIKYNVPFNGSELMDAYLGERPKFPCFVLTSFDDKAINSSHDVNIVYVKNVLNDDKEGKITFADRIFQQIEHYKKAIAEAQTKLEKLISKRKDGIATAPEEQELIDLDSFLENSLGETTAVPKDMKQLSNIERLNSLIGKADEIIAKLERK